MILKKEIEEALFEMLDDVGYFDCGDYDTCDKCKAPPGQRPSTSRCLIFKERSKKFFKFLEKIRGTKCEWEHKPHGDVG